MTLWRLYLTVFLAGSFCLRLSRLVLAVRKARHQGRGRTTSRPIFWIMTSGYVVLLGACAAEGLSHAEAPSWILSGLGLTLYASALLLREKAMRDLGRYFSPDIEIRLGHRVVREGFYKYVRHPLLACLIMEVAGLGLLFNAYRAMTIIGLGFYFPLIAVRQHLEEQALVRELGTDYRLYQREVGAFVPKWQSMFRIGSLPPGSAGLPAGRQGA